MFNQTEDTTCQDHVLCQLPFTNSSVLFLKISFLLQLQTGINDL